MSHHEPGVGVGVVVGQVADVGRVSEGDCESGRVKETQVAQPRLVDQVRGLEHVVPIVTDLLARPHPAGSTQHGLGHREEHRLHPWSGG